jgi:cytochrome c
MGHGNHAIVCLALVLVGCGSQQQQRKQEAGGETTASNAEASPTSRPPVAFAQCMSCHTVESGKNLIGPSLHGVVGRKAASLPGFAYSDALKTSGLTWDEATLDRWLAAPAKLVPGTKMTFFGLPDPAKRKELIAWLARQK